MDIFSHGLWGGLAFGRRSKTQYWLAVLFGILPDLLSFGIYTVFIWLGLESAVDWGAGYPPMDVFPDYIFGLYNLTHSLAVFVFIALLIWISHRRVPIYMFAWPLHILLDFFTHELEFFPTPILWPISDFKFDGVNWSDIYIFVPNVLLLIFLYGIWFYRHHKKVNYEKTNRQKQT